jgi:hypothetical protein
LGVLAVFLAVACGGDGLSSSAANSSGSGASGQGGDESSSTGQGNGGSTTSGMGGAGGEGGNGGQGGSGGSQPPLNGPPGVGFVNAGNKASSQNYTMVFTLGQSTQNQGTTTSPSYRMQGGLVGANGSLP